MKTKAAILIPGTSGLYAGVYRAAKSASKGISALVTTRLGQVESLLRSKSLSKVIVVMGARGRRKGDCGELICAADAYKTLRTMDKKLKIVVMDGWLWKGIPDQILLTGKDTVKAISDQL